jgi:hypothetical protein
MKKLLFLLMLSSVFTIDSYCNKFLVPENGIEKKVVHLTEKLNINNEAIRLAVKGYEKLKELGRIGNMRYLTIADFSKPSSEERLFVIDMLLEQIVIKTLVAHGRNSGTLFANSFSNKNESLQSSLGFYLTGNAYVGKHGSSLELNGVEEGINDQAKNRAIVIHGADYVSNEFIKQQGYIGRSLGCPAVPNNKIMEIVNTIQGASCMFIYAPNKAYLSKSVFSN